MVAHRMVLKEEKNALEEKASIKLVHIIAMEIGT
jgi:hypothetical protein